MNRYEKLMDALLGIEKKKPTHGSCCCCQVCGYWHDECKCDEQIYFRHVLAKLEEQEDSISHLNRFLKKIFHDWRSCGITKSLQDIYYSTKVERICVRCGHLKGDDTLGCSLYGKLAERHSYIDDLEDVDARNLFNTLFDLNLV